MSDGAFQIHDASDADRPSRVLAEAGRRRTFAVISHPDAGKSTLTEALALHAQVIAQAGAVHGKANRRATVSDWMDIERERGISITSAALQFTYRDAVINLVDTPGHADFSEDTYRVLSAVDAAVMLVDAAKGLEPQTLKLFEVCRDRGVPVITFVNKWDRPGREPLELLDEIEQPIGLRPTPLTWPVGIAGDFRGVVDRRAGHYISFTRTAGGASAAPEEVMTAERAAAKEGAAWDAAQEELGLLDAIEADFDPVTYRAGTSTPVLFGSAVPNFGVRLLLDTLLELAPAPTPRPTPTVTRPGIDGAFLRLRVQGAGQHGPGPPRPDRLRPGLLRPVRARHGRHPRRERQTLRHQVRPCCVRPAAHHSRPRLPRRRRRSGQHRRPAGRRHAVPGQAGALPADPVLRARALRRRAGQGLGRYKQFRRGIAQLDQEGVVQVLRSDLRGDQAPVLAAVGPMQFEVATHRMAQEFGAPVHLQSLAYSLARRTRGEDAAALDSLPTIEVLTRGDGALLALFPDRWRLQFVQRDHPDLMLEPLVADNG